MKALSIRQPWAYAILHLGKDIENRSWSTLFRGRFAIHAGKAIDWDGYRFIENEMGLSIPEQLPTGCIVGLATLTKVVMVSDSRWFFGPFGFCLGDPVFFGNPIPCPGRLRFFDVGTEGHFQQQHRGQRGQH